MRLKRLVAISLLAGLFAYSINAYGINTTPTSTATEVTFEGQSRYTDIHTDLTSQKKLALEAVRRAFQTSASEYLPSGYKLSVTVEDIDLAGDRSTLSSPFGEYRVYRDIYAPKISFSYTLLDNNERVIDQGSVHRTNPFYTDQFIFAHIKQPERNAYFVAELVRGWARTELRRAVTKE